MTLIWALRSNSSSSARGRESRQLGRGDVFSINHWEEGFGFTAEVCKFEGIIASTLEGGSVVLNCAAVPNKGPPGDGGEITPSLRRIESAEALSAGAYEYT